MNGPLTMLVINKDSITTFAANINIANYALGSAATIYSYGMAQDTAAETGIGSCDVAQSNSSGVSTNFNYIFNPYSASVFVFEPTAPLLSAGLYSLASGQFELQLSGPSGVPFVLQSSANLFDWTTVSTNILTGNVLNITNTVSGAEPKFWRAAWLP
jgi:hypothetical protein